MLKNLRKCLESEKKDKKIFDIVIYGSAVRGKEEFGDIDIVVIFQEGLLKERLDKIQTIKTKLKSSFKCKIDIKQILLKELFSTPFFARTGIMLEGVSVFKNQKFCETLGFRSFVLFWYNLDGLTHAQKVRFNYILAGRNTAGMLKELNATRLAKGVVKVPVENSAVFEKILKENRVNYSKKSILEEI